MKDTKKSQDELLKRTEETPQQAFNRYLWEVNTFKNEVDRDPHHAYREYVLNKKNESTNTF